MSSLASFFTQYGSLLGEGLSDTLVMLFVSTAFSYVTALHCPESLSVPKSLTSNFVQIGSTISANRASSSNQGASTR